MHIRIRKNGKWLDRDMEWTSDGAHAKQFGYIEDADDTARGYDAELVLIDDGDGEALVVLQEDE